VLEVYSSEADVISEMLAASSSDTRELSVVVTVVEDDESSAPDREETSDDGLDSISVTTVVSERSSIDSTSDT
jgi:hypothetical protein